MRARRSIVAALAALTATAVLHAQPATRRALLVGINDYSASRLPASREGAPPSRSIPNLDGTANDVDMMRELLVELYGFKPTDIVTLKDQEATRDAVLSAITRALVTPAKKNDVIFFYFSGHGSQVANSRSREADHLDESLVPADSRRGADDIRDKELLPSFNKILDTGAHLTIVLDTCHSGSGARGLDGGLRYRGIAPEMRDALDPSSGPLPEERGALILSAAQDFDLAFETLDEHGNIRGAFSWALARAMRDAGAGEPASETFLRARATLHAERPAQDPVLAGTRAAQRDPFLGMPADRAKRHAVIAVERALGSGKYLLQGGWTGGITVGSELRLRGSDDVRIAVTALLGVAHAEARVTRGEARMQPGTLLEIVTWAAPPSPPLRVWIPSAPQPIVDAALDMRDEASRRGIRWIADPTVTTPTHLLRWRDDAWELVSNSRSASAGAQPLAQLPADAALFVQIPAPAPLRATIATLDGIVLTPTPATADYVLAGRQTQSRVEYAWVRPFATAADRAHSGLPLRSAWTAANNASELRELLARLRTVKAWQELRSPTASHYRLALRRMSDGALVQDGKLRGDEPYRLVLRERDAATTEPLYARYLYAFVIDSSGRSVLLFPRAEIGAVENLLPITLTPAEPLRDAPPEIPLDGTRPFDIAEPYGADTYFLLSADEPLPSLAELEWAGVRTPRTSPKSALEELLNRTLAGKRSPGDTVRTPPNWSIDRVVFESVPPRRNAR